MNLRSKISILLAIPLSLQLCTVTVFFVTLSQAESAARKEQQAKKIISLAEETQGLVGLTAMRMTSAKFQMKDPLEAVVPLEKRLAEVIQMLHHLIPSQSPGYDKLMRLENESVRFVDCFKALSRAYVPSIDSMIYAQFFNQDEFNEDLEATYEQLSADLGRLVREYEPMTAELSPEGAQIRATLRYAMMAMVITTAILVLSLGFVVRRQVLQRLSLLMNNIELFGRGEKSMHKLSGSDELAELDRAFREMSAQKFLLDEIQQSLRAMVSHDLRSPLSSISLSLEVVLRDGQHSLDPKTKVTLSRVQSEIQRLSRLAKTLLDIEKLEGGNINADLADVLGSIVVKTSVDAVAALADRRKIVLQMSGDLDQSVRCDEDRTIQCIVNLLSNAIKFAPRESEVTLRGSITVDDRWRLEVVDRGPGVPEEQVSALFNKFVQLDQPESIKAEGSGLGLYICRLLMEAQAGRIGYQPAGETGSCFWLELSTPQR